FSSRRRHTRWPRDWSSDVCSSDLERPLQVDSDEWQRYRVSELVYMGSSPGNDGHKSENDVEWHLSAREWRHRVHWNGHQTAHLHVSARREGYRPFRRQGAAANLRIRERPSLDRDSVRLGS